MLVMMTVAVTIYFQTLRARAKFSHAHRNSNHGKATPSYNMDL